MTSSEHPGNGLPGRLALWMIHRVVRGGEHAEAIVGDFEELAADPSATPGSTKLLTRALGVCWYWMRSPHRVHSAAHTPSDLETSMRRPPRHNRETAMKSALVDVLSALRILRRRRGFKTAVLLTLGVGIGATATIFSVVDSVLLKPLPFEDSERLVAVGTTFPEREWRTDASDLQRLAGVSVANFVDWRQRAHSFDSLAAIEARGVLLPDIGNGVEVGSAAAVTRGLLETLGAGVHLGRGFHEADFAAGAAPVQLLSYSTWQERYGGDPGVVLQDRSGTGDPPIVGVLEPGFALPEAMTMRPPQIWWPLVEQDARYASRGRRSVFVLGRLREGVAVQTAREEMGQLAAQLAEEFPDGNVLSDGRAFGAGVNDLKAETVGPASRLIWIFLAASALLMAVAVLNATNLLLVRALARRRELQVRQALGAGRASLLRLLITESVALALLGGALGTGIAYAGVAAFVQLSPRSVPRLDEVSVDARVLASTVALSVVVGIVGGALSALGLSRRLRLGGLRSTAATAPVLGGRSALVAAQLAIAVVLLVGASLLMTSFLNVLSFEPGFEPEGLWTFSTVVKQPDDEGDQAMVRRWDTLLEEVGAIPGVEQAAAASNLPFQDPNWAPAVMTPGQTPEQVEGGVAGYIVTPNFLEVAQVPLLRGRGIATTDQADTARVAVVNRSFALSRLGSLDVVGTTLRRVGDDDSIEELEVIGVVGDVVRNRAEEGYLPALYLPHTQHAWPRAWVAFRGAGGGPTPAEILPAGTGDALRTAASQVNPVAPAADLAAFGERIRSTHVEPRFRGALLTTFAAVAALLAGLGLYGSLSHQVSRRRREIGIRIALGAQSRRVLALVAGHGLRLMAVGLALGLLGSLAASRVLQAHLFGVEPTSALPVLAAACLLVAVGVMATVVPARRAARTDPASNLRAD